MFCVLGDCNNYSCHHCYPVKNCSLGHPYCIKNGSLTEIKFVLVTGCAGFIGSHLCEQLLQNDEYVLGIDNMNTYYDVQIKESNIEILKKFKRFIFIKDDVRTTNVINTYVPYKIVHLASMAGVRYSIENPTVYIQHNIEGFVHILEQAVKNGVKQVVYASSSSVYGLNNKLPFSENDEISHCNSPYAASKRAMEIFAQTYSQLYNISIIGLRFFTVYGPRGRPDMAPRKFMKLIQNNVPIEKYGNGKSMRDYTHVYDIVNGIISAIHNKKNKKCEVYNLGNSSPITLNEFIQICEMTCGRKATVLEKPEQLGDVPHTYACIDKARKDLNYHPRISVQDGLKTLL